MMDFPASDQFPAFTVKDDPDANIGISDVADIMAMFEYENKKEEPPVDIPSILDIFRTDKDYTTEKKRSAGLQTVTDGKLLTDDKARNEWLINTLMVIVANQHAMEQARKKDNAAIWRDLMRY